MTKEARTLNSPTMTRIQNAVYRASFPSGFRPLVDRLVERDFGPGAVLGGDASTIRYRAPFPPRDPGYFQGISLSIDEIGGGTQVPGIDAALLLFARRLRPGSAAAAALAAAAGHGGFVGSGRRGTFAVRCFVGGSPAGHDKAARRALEVEAERILGRRADSARPELELQVALRDDGSAGFLASLRRDRADDRAAGSLPPSTARLLCELSEPRRDDVFLDPFAGSGSLPLERAGLGPYGMIFSGDSDAASVAALKDKLKEKSFEKRRKTIFPKALDAADLSRFEDGFVTAIVTDPPWGAFDGRGEDEIRTLYAAFLREAGRVLASGGRAVLLVAREGPLDAALRDAESPLAIAEDLSVLVSGRKARAVLLRKK